MTHRPPRWRRALAIGLVPLLLIALALAGCGTKTLTKTVRLTETRTTTVVKRVTPPPLVLVPDQGGDLVYKPDEIGIGASSVINHIRWTGYGGALAVGRGRFPKNTCTPNCAEGTVTWVPVTVRLKERILCRGRLAYERRTGSDRRWNRDSREIGKRPAASNSPLCSCRSA